MSVAFRCISCHHKFRVEDRYVGKKTRCPVCQKRLRIRWNERHGRAGLHVWNADLESRIEALQEIAEYDQLDPLPDFSLPETHLDTPAIRGQSGRVLIGVLVVAVGIILAWWFLRGRTDQPPSPGEFNPHMVSVGVLDLLALYSVSEDVADSQYKDKQLHLSGEVGRIGKDKQGREFATFKSSKEFSGITVVCSFDPAKPFDAATLGPGERVMIAGTCLGLEKHKLSSENTADYPNLLEVKPPISGKHLILINCSLYNPSDYEGSMSRRM